MTPMPKKRVRKPRIIAPVELPQTPEEMEALLEKGRQAGEEAEAMINDLPSESEDELSRPVTIEELYGYWENAMRYLELKGHMQGGLLVPVGLWKRIKRILGKGGWMNITDEDTELIKRMMEGIPK
jgi:hypothetical protein